jgi:hypothetical protein
MASLKDCDQARDEHAETLRQLGAHGIMVDQIGPTQKQSFAVVAFFETQPEQIPKHLTITRNQKTVNVPLEVRIMPPLQFEALN